MSLLRINHNIASINTQRNLNLTSFELNKTLQRMSSGFRINVAADGPADLIISENLRSQITGMKTALRNSQEAANFIGVAEGALVEITNILTSMRALAVHAANTGVVSQSQVQADQTELNRSLESINRIVTATRFAGDAVFTTSMRVFHVGEGATSAADEVTFSIGEINTSLLGISSTYQSGTVDLFTDARGAISLISYAANAITSLRGRLGAFQRHTLQANINSLSVTLENMVATESYIRDANMAEEASEFTRNQVLVQSGISVLAQANAASQSVLQLLR
ncbi:MAG TPA: flagellin [Planctomycetota bacterium]|nr:flagellin [Planctomycetota bacterium]